MGYRDLRYFNLAMLAKQGWRLLKNHKSLMFKCFKARYFPRCDFLHAKDSPNSSFVWKSMVSALPILKSGCCWRVGNGESIEALMDKWIPNYPSNKILHPVHGMEEGWRVSDLIDWGIHVWKRDIIMAHFNREEAEAICRIPLSRRGVKDSVTWMHNKKGECSVRSGYHLARQVLRKADWAESSNRSGRHQLWSTLWKLKIPGKINNCSPHQSLFSSTRELRVWLRFFIQKVVCSCKIEIYHFLLFNL